MQVNVIPLKSILFGSQFKVVFLTGWACWIALGLLMLFVSVIAPSALTINGEVAKGIGDGFVAFVIAVLVGGFASALCSVIGCGVLGFVSRFISLGNISYNSDGV